MVHLPLEQPDIPAPLKVAQLVPSPSVTHPPHEVSSCWVSRHSYGVARVNSLVSEIGQANNSKDKTVNHILFQRVQGQKAKGMKPTYP